VGFGRANRDSPVSVESPRTALRGFTFNDIRLALVLAHTKSHASGGIQWAS